MSHGAIATNPAALAAPIVDDGGDRVIKTADRVPVAQKCVYGAAGAVVVLEGHLPKTLANPVFVVMLGLSPSAVTLAMMSFRLYDAFLAPVVGWLSDNARTRWGRRRPFILVGAVLTGLCLPLMWLVRPGWSHGVQLAWFIGAGVLLYTAATIFAMPYESLSLELTPDYDERTSVNSYKAFAQKLAVIIVGWAWYLTLSPIFADPVTGATNALRGALGLSVVIGALVVALGVLPAFFVRERFYKAAAAQPGIKLSDSLRYTLSSSPFQVLVTMSVLFITATYLASGIGFYLRLYYVTAGDQALASKIGGVESTLTMLLGIASIPCFAWLAHRSGKTVALMVAMGITFAAMVANWFTYDPRWPWLSMTSSILLAPSITGIWQLIQSMNGDVVDHDELRTGERREGAFASIYSWIVKASFTAGIALSGPVVERCGFAVSLGAHQSPKTLTSMRVAMAILPAALLGLGMIVLTRYPLTPTRMRDVRAELEARRGLL